MRAHWALNSFPNSRVKLDTTTLVFCSTFIFAWYLLLITATTKNPALQRCDIIQRNVVWSNVETLTTSSLRRVQQMSSIAVSLLQTLKDLEAILRVQCGTLEHLGTQFANRNPRHYIWIISPNVKICWISEDCEFLICISGWNFSSRDHIWDLVPTSSYSSLPWGASVDRPPVPVLFSVFGNTPNPLFSFLIPCQQSF